MELVTGPLSPEQMWNEAAWLADTLQAEGVHQVTVAYGFGCDCDLAEQYKDIAVDVATLKEHLERAPEDWTCRLGDGDIYVSVPGLGLKVLFCHECDVHAEAEGDNVAALFRRRWLAQGIEGHKKRGSTWISLHTTGSDDNHP